VPSNGVPNAQARIEDATGVSKLLLDDGIQNTIAYIGLGKDLAIVIEDCLVILFPHRVISFCRMSCTSIFEKIIYVGPSNKAARQCGRKIA